VDEKVGDHLGSLELAHVERQVKGKKAYRHTGREAAPASASKEYGGNRTASSN
jgi:hypothetical protein